MLHYTGTVGHSIVSPDDLSWESRDMSRRRRIWCDHCVTRDLCDYHLHCLSVFLNPDTDTFEFASPAAAPHVTHLVTHLNVTLSWTSQWCWLYAEDNWICSDILTFLFSYKWIHFMIEQPLWFKQDNFEKITMNFIKIVTNLGWNQYFLQHFSQYLARFIIFHDRVLRFCVTKFGQALLHKFLNGHLVWALGGLGLDTGLTYSNIC